MAAGGDQLILIGEVAEDDTSEAPAAVLCARRLPDLDGRHRVRSKAAANNGQPRQTSSRGGNGSLDCGFE